MNELHAEKYKILAAKKCQELNVSPLDLGFHLSYGNYSSTSRNLKNKVQNEVHNEVQNKVQNQKRSNVTTPGWS